MSTETKPDVNIDRSVGDFSYDVNYEFDAGLGDDLAQRQLDPLQMRRPAPQFAGG